ncbi:MAG: hypothetical protein ACI814_001967 [Mariniblastus sp.]|jgi:hypothetical protein
MQSHRGLIGLAVLALMGFIASNALAQTAEPRPLAKNVLIKPPTDLAPRDTHTQQMVMPNLNATEYEPKTIPNEETLYGQSRRVILYRDIYQYEFAFTGLRQTKLTVPTANGMRQKNFWYSIYRLRDTNQTMTYEKVKPNPDFDHETNVLKMGGPIAQEKKQLNIRFTLEGSVVTTEGNYQKVAYRDIVDPLVVNLIRQREDANQRLLDTQQMATATIPIAKNDTDPGVWGVAVWENVDPRLDYVSVFVKGLTNAYRLNPNLAEPAKLKTLQLNFWRPGDQVNEQNDRVEYGIPLTDDPVKQVLICQQYDLPGPVIRGYFVNKDAKRDIQVLEADAKVNLKDFRSALTPTLDQGKLPPSIAESFAQSGVTLDNGLAITTMIQGHKWSLKQGQNEYILALEPQYWERDFVGIRFIKSLDHMWIYR